MEDTMSKTKKILRGTPLHLSKSGTLDGFSYLAINLPFQCNFQCRKCFNQENNIPRSTQQPLKLNKILKLIDEAKTIGAKVVVLAGEGEPTLSQVTKYIILKTDSLGMLSIVYSNGSTLTEEIIKFYAKHNTTLVISFDSLDKNIYKNLTGIRDDKIFELVMENIKIARKIYNSYIEKKKNYNLVRLAMVTCISSLNKDHIKNIKEFCGSDIYFICNPLANLGNAIGNWNNLIKSKDDYDGIQRLATEMSETTGPLTLGKNKLCGYSINGIAISPSGDYMTCAYTSLTDGLFGSVFDQSLAEAYNYKKEHEQKFYNKYGDCPCLVRSSNFDKYMENLRTS